MSLFLVAVNRKVAKQRSSSTNDLKAESMLYRVGENYAKFLGNDFVAKPTLTAPEGRRDVKVLHWERFNAAEGVRSSGKNWAISGGQNVAEKLLKSVQPRGGTLEYARPVWGFYSAVFGAVNDSQVFAWNTTPAIDAIHWAATEEFILISNRPVLVALFLSLLQNNDSPELCLDYLAEYLLYGYSISGRTPFKSVYTLSVNSGIAIANGNLRITPVPAGLVSRLSTEHTLDDAVDALHSSLVNAMDRVEDELDGRPLQLRLSGGKDSRLLLALLRGRDIDYRTVTFGGEASVDVKLASRLNEMSGIHGEMRSPRLADGNTIVERIESTLRESGGIPASEAHTAQYRGSDPERDYEAIMMGHWPLYKGGMATRLGLSTKEINHVLKWQGGGLTRNEVRAVFDTDIRHWGNELALSEEIEKLYLFAREFRSGRYLHAHMSQYAGGSLIAYPLADSEVGAVCDALTMGEKVTEKALFRTLERLWPEVMRVPLDQSTWRFEKEGPDPEFSGSWYEQRISEVPDSKPAKITTVRRAKSEYSDEAVLEMAAHIRRSDNFSFLTGLLSDGMNRAIVEGARGEICAPNRMPDKTFKKFIWRICVADVWLSKNWSRSAS